MPPMDFPPSTSFAASITNAAPVRCERRQSCRGAPDGLHPPGTRLYPMNLKRTKTKIHICVECREHYFNKDSTIRTERSGGSSRRTASGTTGLPIQVQQPVGPRRVAGHVPKGDAQIHALTAAAQRNERVEVRAIGTIPMRSGPSGPLRPRSNLHGPQITHSNGGYTPSHDDYEAARVHSRNRAMAVHSTITGAITVRLVYLPPKGKLLQMFETCQVSVGEVHVGIGAVELLRTAFNAMEPVYRTAIQNLGYPAGTFFPLSINNVQMVNKDTVPLKMSVEQNLIRQHFYRPAKDGIALVYNHHAKPFLVQLLLSATWYSKA